MKFIILATSIAQATLALCSVDDTKTTIDVASAISSFYPSSTPSLNGAQSTSLAKALLSVESSWYDTPAYTSAQAAIYSAAPSSVQKSIESSGYLYNDLTSQDWYTKSVPHAVQTAVAGEIKAFDSAAEKIIGTATSSSSKGVGARARARATGLGVAGVVGVVGGVLAAL
ncbi:hypothetical protein D0Z07_9111 [Hyphodiscus hymeniophilus]|uniref:Uncharacterized protein n=1 Tax=Hyphodiscus hymeniophilus TaxID=353542 RepID=A0A9P6SK44_9HELO|nr:hypothetical protein D0Z07_9111 [Hyphodiscus hymeniophilus]